MIQCLNVLLRYDTIRYAILACARKPTWVELNLPHGKLNLLHDCWYICSLKLVYWLICRASIHPIDESEELCFRSVRPSVRARAGLPSTSSLLIYYLFIYCYRLPSVLWHCWLLLLRHFQPWFIIFDCRPTNFELLRWLVETPSRDFEHFRMSDDSQQSIVRHCHVRWKCRMIDRPTFSRYVKMSDHRIR